MSSQPHTIPDFVVPGFAKSGTTTLCDWLSQLPTVPRLNKESHFFTNSEDYSKGRERYVQRLGWTGTGLVGDYSTSYGDPRRAATAVRRILEFNPDAKFVFVYRDPIDRAVSHFRFEVKRGRERAQFSEARDRITFGSDYVEYGRYADVLEIYLEACQPANILCIPVETLATKGWPTLLSHIGLEKDLLFPIDRTPSHVTAEGPSRTQFLNIATKFRPARRLSKRAPEPLRKVLRPALLGPPMPAIPPSWDPRQELDRGLVEFLDDQLDRFVQLVNRFDLG